MSAAETAPQRITNVLAEPRWITCDACLGSGKNRHLPTLRACSVCGGTGLSRDGEDDEP